MISLLIAVGALFLAVIASTIIDPWPSRGDADDVRADDGCDYHAILTALYSVAGRARCGQPGTRREIDHGRKHDGLRRSAEPSGAGQVAGTCPPL